MELISTLPDLERQLRLLEKSIVYLQHGIMLEVAIPEILECLDWPKVPSLAESIEGIGDWSANRQRFWKNKNVDKVLTGEYQFLHPFKLSVLLESNATEAKKSFCQKVLPYMYQMPS